MGYNEMSNDQLIYKLSHYSKERDENNFEIKLIMNVLKERGSRIRDEVKLKQTTVEKLTEKKEIF